jgi:hypothetical protein
MAADSAQAQMNPPTAGFQAFLAAFRTGRDAPDFVEMITLFHCFTPDLVLGIDVWKSDQDKQLCRAKCRQNTIRC